MRNNPLIAFFTILTFVSSNVLGGLAWADEAVEEPAPEQVTTIQEGEVAPFTGTLFSTTAAAKLVVDLEFNQEACDLEITRRLRLSGAEYQLQIDTLNVSLESLQLRTTSQLQIRDEHIEFLELELRPTPWWKSSEFGFVMGILTGVGVTIGAGYALHQVSQ